MSSENQFSSVVPGDLQLSVSRLNKHKEAASNASQLCQTVKKSTPFHDLLHARQICGSECDDSWSPRSLTPR